MLLTTPLAIKALTLRNRLVLPPMATEKSVSEGEVSQALCDYYNEKTQGGYFGLVVTEHSYINKEGQASVGQVSLSKDEDVEGLRKLVEVIHSNGSKVMAQINHAGGKSICALDGKTTAPAPTGMPYTTTRGEAIESHTMTQDEIDQVISDFVSAACRAKEAGYDGVEIHSAHGYLLNQFYSPLTNKRDDAYTGSTIEGRLRLHCQVVRAVRWAVGPDYAVALRLGACDYREGGSSDGSKVPGYFGEESKAIKQAVSVPVILTGGVRDGASLENLLEQDKADLIGVGRAVLKDSQWAKKAFEELGISWTA